MLKISADLSLPIEAVTQTFAILAKRGAGKSYTGCVLVEEMLKVGQQVVIADPIGVWWGLRSSADGKSPGFPIVVFGGEHGDLPLEEHAGEIVASAIVENGFSAVLDLSLFRKAAQVRFMTAFAETLYRLNRKPLHFMVDEADEFAPQRPMHGAERLLGAFEDIVRRGRARGLGVTLITQRAAVLNKNVLTQIEVLVVLRTISPQDRAAIEAWTEIHGTERQLAQLSETMASLPIGTAWFWSPGWLDIFKKITVRAKTTFDSSATPKVGEVVIKPKALAEVDLNKLGTQIKATAETAKANNPAELKKEITALRKQLAEKPMPQPVKVETKEVHILVATELHHIKMALSEYRECQAAIKKVEPVIEKIEAELARYTEIVGPNKNHYTTVTPRQNPVIHHAVPVVQRKQASELANPSNNGSELDAAKRKILETISMLYARGLVPNREMIARWMDIHPHGGRYGSNLAWLRENGYLQGCDFDDAANAEIESEEPGGLDGAKRVVDGACGQILDVLAGGGTFDRESLAQALGIHPNGGRYGSNLARLRTMGLIPKLGPIKLTEAAFK